MPHTAPTLRLEPSPSDRFLADARRRSLHDQLTRYMSREAADTLLSGQPVDVDVAPEREAALKALMPQVSRFVREGK